ncbi:MAG: oxidoreductase [Roseibaca calidilacus]|uniref:Oxidoreductase n=1 Tax=Roseibaca calidilacus TaxID=1666912 RepID=A0A0P7WIN0_9RHOB|nr:DUF934 domain-containing protein [Roseibaca calidilacus]KPP93988.1 MAG: oxidoreductase [Roseibaca calidilacus]CUX79466.1 protein of unknown function (DUF934) [Roseibaca calidilacus]
MNVLVTDAGFAPLDQPDDPAKVLTLAPDTDPDALPLPGKEITLICVTFPGVADGRGFTLARSLRRKGYTGRLRACGQIMPDQYAMARRSGFDEVEIEAARAALQPEADWQARADWQATSYLSRLQAQRAS